MENKNSSPKQNFFWINIVKEVNCLKNGLSWSVVGLTIATDYQVTEENLIDGFRSQRKIAINQLLQRENQCHWRKMSNFGVKKTKIEREQ